MIVGVGASRVRDLFKQAKEAAPAIIFIDELDAIGRARGGGASLGGHDEREQTLNQILTEMDGFTGSEGVIVLAATNRPEILDSALLRPGRFDRRVVVNPPDQAGRRADPRGPHALACRSADDVDLKSRRRRRTPGMVGADLQEPRQRGRADWPRGANHEQVELADFTDALEKIILGAERRHHALAATSASAPPTTRPATRCSACSSPGADPVRKVSIVPRGRALGVTFQSPDADRYGYDARYLRGPHHRRARRPGGRGDRLRRRHDRRRVRPRAGHADRPADGRPLGHVGEDRPGVGAARAAGRAAAVPGQGRGGPSEATRELVDAEVRRIVEECYAEAIETLRDEPRQARRRWRRPCSSARRSTRPTPTPPPASPAASIRPAT